MGEYTWRQLKERLLDFCYERGFSDGIKRCKETGIARIYFDIDAVYVEEEHHREGPTVVLLTNTAVRFRACHGDMERFAFTEFYCSDTSPTLHFIAPLRDGKYAEGKLMGAEAVRQFLETEFSGKIRVTLKQNGFEGHLGITRLRKDAMLNRRTELNGYIHELL